MLKHRLASAALSALIACATPGLCPAAADAARGAFVKDRPAPVGIERDGILVESYRFDRLTRGGANPFKMGSGPSIILNVKNQGTAEKDFGIAVALFDKDGRLVGAGTGSKTGKLDPGETNEIKVVFHDVSRDVHRAATIYLTLETER